MGETRRGKAREREREGGMDAKEGRETGELERSGAFPRTVGPRSGVGCPALISTRTGSGFPSNPVLPKQSKQWVDNESDLCVIFIWS